MSFFGEECVGWWLFWHEESRCIGWGGAPLRERERERERGGEWDRERDREKDIKK